MTATPRRILLVEDEPDIAEMLRFFFEQHGFRFLHAPDGESALRLAHQKMPHLILLDTILPDMDGFQICKLLRQTPATAHIPIIFLTRRAERDNLIAALEMGADDFLAKPFDPDELLLRVQNNLRRVEQTARIDAESGLPSAAFARDYVARARWEPGLAIVEIQLLHSVPYRQRYGKVAMQKIYSSLGQLVVWMLGQLNTPETFAGYVNESQIVVVLPEANAEAFARHLADVFNPQVGNYYQDTDRERGYVDISNERHPLMRVVCRVHIGHVALEIV